MHEWNVGHKDAQVEVTDFSQYGAPVDIALDSNSEDQPTLVLAPEFTTAKMREALAQKKVIPIGQFLDDDRLSNIAEIVKRTFGNSEGRLDSLPFNPSCGVIYTNKALLQKIGKDQDYVPRSIEELENVCRELLEKGCVEAGYTSAWPAAYLVEVPAAQQDIALVKPKNGMLGYGSYVLNSEWLVQHLLDLRRQHQEKIYTYEGKDNNSRKKFVEGKVAFFMQGSPHNSWLSKEASEAEQPFEVGCGPLPTLVQGQTERYAFPLGGASIWVMNNQNTTKMVEHVRAFLNYLSGAETQERWHKETGYVPVRTLPKRLEAFYRNHPVHRAVVAQTIESKLGEHSFGIHMPNYKEARERLFDLIEEVLDPQTPDERVRELLAEFDKNFSIPADTGDSPRD